MLSVVGKTGTIVEAMRLGAADYLNKPFEEEELEATLAKVLERRALERERVALGEAHATAGETIAWASAAMQRVKALLEQVADTDVTVLIQGESGSGKEIVARTLHAVSSRAQARFVKVNCAALPEDLLESELFGYEKGAFTGAAARKQGKFEQAARRHDLPRRDRGDEPGPAGEAAPGAPGRPILAARRQPGDRGRRARRVRHQPEARRHGARGHASARTSSSG